MQMGDNRNSSAFSLHPRHVQKDLRGTCSGGGNFTETPARYSRYIAKQLTFARLESIALFLICHCQEGAGGLSINL